MKPFCSLNDTGRRFWAILLTLAVAGAPLQVAAQGTVVEIQASPTPNVLTIASSLIIPDYVYGDPTTNFTGSLSTTSSVVVTSCADFEAKARRTFFPWSAIPDVCLTQAMDMPPEGLAVERFAKEAIRVYLIRRGLDSSVASVERIIEFKRDIARAAVYAALIETIVMEAAFRNSDQRATFDWFTREVHKRKILSAQFALEEYRHWEAAQCGYRPPPGFSYDPGNACGSRLTGLFSFGPPIPNFAQFGAARAYSSSTTGSTNRAQAAVAEALTASAQAAAAAAIGGFFTAGFAAASTTVATVGSFTVWAVSPFLAAGPVAAVLLVIAGIVAGSLDLSARSQLESNLTKAVENAKNTPPVLRTMAQDKAQQSILYITFIETTVFEGPDPVGPATLSSWGGPGWQNLSTGVAVQEIQYKAWDNANWRAALNGGLFAHAPGTSPGGHMDFMIKYVDWNNIRWTATFDIGRGAFTVFDNTGFLKFRTDTLEVVNHTGQPIRVKFNGAVPQSNPFRPLFVHTREGAASGHVDTRIDYLTWNGTAWRAFLAEAVSNMFFPWLHVPASGGGFSFDSFIAYKSWDNQDYKAWAQADKSFLVIRSDGTPIGYRSTLFYKTHDGSNWSAMIQ